MPFSTSFRLALRTLGRNRLRSALTLVGVTIGVAVVVTMVAVGTGARLSIERHVRAAGTNQITVVAGNYMRIAGDFGSDVMEGGGGSETPERLEGLAGGSTLSSAPASRHESSRAAEEWWPGKGISPRLPGLAPPRHPPGCAWFRTALQGGPPPASHFPAGPGPAAPA